MKLHYIQNTHDAQIGDIREVENPQAHVLILLGIAKEYVEKPEKDEKNSETPVKTAKKAKKES